MFLHARSLLPVMLAVALVSAISTRAQAAKLDYQASVAPSIILTDNVCLSKDNKEWDWIGKATPSGSVSLQGRRASARVSGAFDVNTLRDSDLKDNNCGALGSRQEFAPRIRANAQSVLIDQWLRINATGTANQRPISSAFAGGDDDLNRRGNQYTYYRYSVSPTLSHRIGRRTNGTLRYIYDELINSEDFIANSKRNAATLNFTGTGPLQTNWGVGGRYTKVEYEEVEGRLGRTSELKSVNFRLGYQYDRRWQFNGTIGQDFNDVNRNSNFDNGGAYWRIGLRWTPSSRTTVSTGAGDRFFGKTPELNITHRHKSSVFNASYKKTITFDRDIRSALEDGDFVDEGGTGPSIISQEPIIDSRYSLSWSRSGRKVSVSARGSYSEQTRDVDGEESVFKSMGLTLTPKLSSRYTVSGSLTWSADEPRTSFPNTADVSNNSETWRLSTRISRQFNRRFGGSLRWAFTDRQSDIPRGEYQENRLTATLTMRF